jgi:RNA polymerase subunit RPABC4/transcription elongation factor Spt4
MSEQEPKKSYTPCRYCKQEIRLNTRRCPYCGTFNPTVKIKDIIITTVAIVAVLYALSFFIN